MTLFKITFFLNKACHYVFTINIFQDILLNAQSTNDTLIKYTFRVITVKRFYQKIRKKI